MAVSLFRLLRLCRLAVASVLATALFSQGQTPPEGKGVSSPQDIATNLTKMHQAWGPGLNSPNASISLEEVTRSGGIVKYRLRASGLPHEAKYALLSWPVTQKGPSEALTGVTLAESGLAICAGLPETCGTPDKPNDPIELTLSPVKSEPLRVALVSMGEQKLRAFLKIVPIPNEASDKACRIESVLLMPGAALVAIQANGFQPNAELSVETDSAGERHGGKGKAGSDGTYFAVVMPHKKGAQRGTTHVRIKSAECSPALNFDWGK